MPTKTRLRDPQGRFISNGHRRPHAIVAAASTINLEERSEAQRAILRHAEWQRDAWNAYDVIGEVKYATNLMADTVSKLRVFVADRPDENDPAAEPELTSNPTAIDVGSRLTGSRMGDTPELMRETALNFMVTGECYLVGRQAEDGPSNWSIHSISEIEPMSSGGWGLRAHRGARLERLDEATLIRLWLPHPEFGAQPDSPLRGVLNVCDEILIFERAKRAIGRNRAAMAGFFLFPDELTMPEPAARDDVTEPEDSDPLLRRLQEIISTALQNEGSAAAAVPIFLRGPGEQLANAKTLQLERPIDTQLDPWLERALRRLAQGLNMPPEVVLGLEGINHWTAWQIEESTFKAHVEPLAVKILDSFTRGYLWPTLEASGVGDPEQYLYWYDASRLVSRPNREARAAEALERDAISWKAYRQVLGFDDSDAPADDELVRRQALRGGGIDAFLKEALLRMLKPDLLVERLVGPGVSPVTTPVGRSGPNGGPVTPEQGPPPAERPEPSEPVMASAADGRMLGRTLAEIDRMLRERLLVAASGAVQRALERVGARLRSRAQRSTKAEVREVIASSANADVARTLGPTVVAALGLPDEELEELFDPLIANFLSWTARAQERALRLAGDVTPEIAAGIALEQQAAREEAAEWLRAKLVEVTRMRLFDSAVDSEIGEFDETLVVPAGLIREAIARAGGQINLESFGAWVSLGANARVPLGGIGTGETIQRLLREQGWGTEGYQWEYGAYPRTRPFEPHQNLDGVTFGNFDDARLANTSGFPAVPFYLPGDHSGCFVAGTIVAGPRAWGMTERFYEGDVIDILTASGALLTATANHPILTSHGWIPARLLNEGSDVIRCRRSERPPSWMHPDDYQVPALIEKVTRTSRDRAPMPAVRMPTAPEDFHGDGKGSEVHVVRTDRLLRYRLDPALEQMPLESTFVDRYSESQALAGEGRSHSAREGIGATTLRLMRTHRITSSLFGSQSRVTDELRFRSGPNGNIGPQQTLANSSPIGAIALRQGKLRITSDISRDHFLDWDGISISTRRLRSYARVTFGLRADQLTDMEFLAQAGRTDVSVQRGALDTFASEVEPDRILKLRRRSWSGHVYNLDTRLGWYTANGIIVGNCVCDVIPVLVAPSVFGVPVVD